MHAGKRFLLREPAVRACDDVLSPHYTGEPHDPVRNYLRMLHRDDVVSNHAGNKYFSGRQFDALPDAPLVLVAWIRGLEGIGLRRYLQNEIHDLLQRRIDSVWQMPAAEAHMIANPLLRNIT